MKALTKNRDFLGKPLNLLAGVLLMASAVPVWAGAEAMAGMDHAAMQDGNQGMNMGEAAGAMQGGSAPADARDPHAYSDGYGFGPIARPRFADEMNFYALLADRFELVDGEDGTWALYDIQAWYGRTYDRLVVKAEGEVNNGTLEEASTELLWGHAVATYWDLQLGVRYDSGEAADQG